MDVLGQKCKNEVNLFNLFLTIIKRNTKTIIVGLISFVLISFILTWAPWLDNKEIHNRVFQEKSHKDGTMGWVTQPDGTKEYTLICDLIIM